MWSDKVESLEVVFILNIDYLFPNYDNEADNQAFLRQRFLPWGDVDINAKTK